ncbi:MAG TPA: phosphatidate cytidylyltransferase [Lacipirellulaceae bacterium]|nr:phosphatidate cytidylyltransferase [Lacipirellulaceae bacterium]
MLRYRFLLGILFVAGLAMLCWLDCKVTRPGAFLLPVALMVAWMGVVELLEIFNKRGRMPLPWVLYSGVLIIVLLSGLEVLWPEAVSSNVPGQLGWMSVGVIVGLYLALFGELQRYDTKWHTTINLGLEAFSILYLGAALGFMVQLRLLSMEPKDPFGLTAPSGQAGMLALVSLIAIVKMSDIGQYAVGRLIGRHKLAPLISPGKTWEGVVGGLLFAIGGAFLVFGWAEPYIMGTPNQPANLFGDPVHVVRLVIYAVAIAAAGILGDLAESVLKREAGVKDSSSWMPGFGGVLDLLDSLLGAAPIAYLLWVVGLVAP